MKKASAKKPQLDRFRETARALGCDEDKARFDAALEKIVTRKPPPTRSAPSPKKSRKPAK